MRTWFVFRSRIPRKNQGVPVAPSESASAADWRIPGVVFELGLGIIVGPDVLKLAHTSGVVNGFSDMGLAFLMFLAGFELDLLRIRGRPLRLASLGWVASAGLAVAIALAVVSTGLVHDPVVLGLSLTTTARGTLLPVLRDASVFDTEFGRYVMAVGTVGEFGPIVAVAVFLTQRDPLITIALLFFFVATAVGAALLATRTQQPRVVAILRRNPTPVRNSRSGYRCSSSCCWSIWLSSSALTCCWGRSPPGLW